MHKAPADDEILLHAAASAFHNATGLRAAVLPSSTRFDLQPDASMRFDLGDGRICTLPVTVRRAVDRFSAVSPMRG